MESFLYNKRKISVKWTIHQNSTVSKGLLGFQNFKITDHKYQVWILRIIKHRLFGQTTKQPLNNFEPQKPWKYKQFWGLRPDPSCLEKNKCKKDKSWTT